MPHLSSLSVVFSMYELLGRCMIVVHRAPHISDMTFMLNILTGFMDNKSKKIDRKYDWLLELYYRIEVLRHRRC